MLRALDLFSGIGGISLALRDYARTVGYVEIDKYAQSVLLSRMVSGDIEPAPIFRDITRLDGTKLHGSIDLLSGGFPCQDISVAGAGKGLDGERSGLFFEICRLVREIKPVFIFLENVPAIRTRGLDAVLKELASIGYDCRWTVISAASIGAPHKRERWFLLAHSNSVWKLSTQGEHDWIGNGREDVAHTLFKGLERQWEKSCGNKSKQHDPCDNRWWATEPSVGRVVNGLPFRMDRIKCLGNSVVPLQVKTAFEKLLGIYNATL